MSLPIPTVHWNGTSGKALYAEYAHAADKLQDAIDALHEATLNARDYYPQGPSAFNAAREHRIKMTESLGLVFEDLIAIAMGINDQT